MNEDIQFLKDFQQELNTQEIDSQAAPRYWALMDYRIVPANEDYDAEDVEYYYNDGDHVKFENVEELKEFIEDADYDEADEELQNLLDDGETSFEDLWEYVKDNLNDDGFFDEVSVKEESFLVPNTMFLTKAEAQQHIKLNHYHYTKKVHTYAMTAWRAPKVERLFKILETFDWDQIKLKEDLNG